MKLDVMGINSDILNRAYFSAREETYSQDQSVRYAETISGYSRMMTILLKG